jgi:hypothetical protein
VRLGLRDFDCFGLPCTPPAVTFGGVPARSVVVEPDGSIVAVTPQHDPGLVDVAVTDRDVTTTASSAYLFPTSDADLTSESERVLFLSVFAGPGAHGSDWTSDNFVRNDSPIQVRTIPPLVTDSVCTLGCAPRDQEPGEEARLPHFSRDGGMFLFVPRGVESLFSYSSHIVDRSRRQTDAGTEMHVVHESEGGPSLTLLNVPLAAESRQTLRIFDLDAVERPVLVEVRLQGGSQLVTLFPTLANRIVCVTTPCYPEHPTFTTINLDGLASLQDAGTATIVIRSRTNEARLWAYVSVTHNDTQHVTTVTPQHRRRPANGFD